MARILVVEDDPEIRELLRDTLRHEQHEVECAGDGVEAVECYRRWPADLVILDIIMPRKEGIETILELRADDPDVKIIAISGGGRIGADSYLSIARRVGARETFSKPLDRREVLTAVRGLVSA